MSILIEVIQLLITVWDSLKKADFLLGMTVHHLNLQKATAEPQARTEIDQHHADRPISVELSVLVHC